MIKFQGLMEEKGLLDSRRRQQASHWMQQHLRQQLMDRAVADAEVQNLAKYVLLHHFISPLFRFSSILWCTDPRVFDSSTAILRFVSRLSSSCSTAPAPLHV